MYKLVAVGLVLATFCWTAGCVGAHYAGTSGRFNGTPAFRKPDDLTVEIKMGFHSGIAAVLNPKGRIVKKPLETYRVEPPDAFLTAGISAAFDLVSGRLAEEMVLEVAQGRSNMEERTGVPLSHESCAGIEQTTSLRYNTIFFLANRENGSPVLRNVGLSVGGGAAYTSGDILQETWDPVLSVGAGYFKGNLSLRIDWVLFPGREAFTDTLNLSFGISF